VKSVLIFAIFPLLLASCGTDIPGFSSIGKGSLKLPFQVFDKSNKDESEAINERANPANQSETTNSEGVADSGFSLLAAPDEKPEDHELNKPNEQGTFVSEVECDGDGGFDSVEGMSWFVSLWIDDQVVYSGAMDTEGCSKIKYTLQNVETKDHTIQFGVYMEFDGKNYKFKDCEGTFGLDPDSDEEGAEEVAPDVECKVYRRNGISGTIGLAKDQ
jgi:hypothetical protein